MTQNTEEITVAELTFFIRFGRVRKELGIDMTPGDNIDHVMLEVARKTPTDKLLTMIAGYKEITVGPVKEMTEIMIDELKTRGVLKG